VDTYGRVTEQQLR